MTSPSHSTDEISRNVASTVLRALSGVKGSELASLLDKSEATISRVTQGTACLTLEEWAKVIAAAGLEVVARANNGSLATIDREELNALRLFARRGIG